MKVVYMRVHKGKVTDIDNLKTKFLTTAVPFTLVLLSGNEAFAAGVNVKTKLQPIITALQDLAEPVAYAFMIYGGLKYISGKSSEGQKILKQAIGGYVLIQWIPWIFSIIKGIGK